MSVKSLVGHTGSNCVYSLKVNLNNEKYKISIWKFILNFDNIDNNYYFLYLVSIFFSFSYNL